MCQSFMRLFGALFTRPGGTPLENPWGREQLDADFRGAPTIISPPLSEIYRNRFVPVCGHRPGVIGLASSSLGTDFCPKSTISGRSL